MPGCFMPLARSHGAFQNGNGFCRVGSLGRFSRLDIPEQPGGAVHDRLGEEGCHVEIILMRKVDLAHRGGIVVVPDGRDIAGFV